MKLGVNLHLVQMQQVELQITTKLFLLKSWHYLVYVLNLSLLPRLCLLSGFSSFVFPPLLQLHGGVNK